jgi:hypothetical protein
MKSKGTAMRATTRFRLLIEAPEILLLPGVHDGLTLRLAERAGFEAVTCGGYAATASLLGAPGVAQLGMSEMAEMYARLCDATELPVFADGDTGYGNTTNVARTVRAYERAGVAGLFIEDQVAPKRCGHMEGKRVVPPAEMVAKLRAALDARVDATTRNALVRARIEGAANVPPPGASVRIRVPVGSSRRAIAVPVSALRTGPGGDHVFVVAPDKDGQARAHIRQVESGPTLADRVVVLAGLSAGEQVAATGSFKLRDGVLVAVAGRPGSEPKRGEGIGGR